RDATTGARKRPDHALIRGVVRYCSGKRLCHADLHAGRRQGHRHRDGCRRGCSTSAARAGSRAGAAGKQRNRKKRNDDGRTGYQTRAESIHDRFSQNYGLIFLEPHCSGGWSKLFVPIQDATAHGALNLCVVITGGNSTNPHAEDNTGETRRRARNSLHVDCNTPECEPRAQWASSYISPETIAPFFL